MHSMLVFAALSLFGANPEIPETPVITACPTVSDTMTEVELVIRTTDPKKRDIAYSVDWGDGTPLVWTRPVNNGAEAYQYHTYRKQGVMSIKGRAAARVVPGDSFATAWSKPASLEVKASLYKWKFPLPAGTFSSAALDAAGNVYFGDEDGILYSLTPDGKLRWTYRVPGTVEVNENGQPETVYDPISAAVAVDGNTVYFPCEDKHLYALSLDGKLLWSYKTATRVVAGPAIGTDGMAYCADDSGVVYALNNQGILKWSHVTNDEVDNGLTIGPDGTIYVASDSLYAFSPAGKELWAQGAQEEDNPFYGVSIGPDNNIYTGNMDGFLYRLDAKGGRIMWRSPSEDEDEIHGEAVFGPDGTIYFGSDDYYLNHKQPNGSGSAMFEADDRLQTTPAVNGNGTVYLNSQDGMFYVLDAKGQVKWKKQIGSGDFDWIPSSPTIGPDGTVYIGSFEDGFYAFYGDGLPVTGKWSMLRGNAQHNGRAAKK